MRILVSIFIIVLALSGCGKKSDPKYQAKLNYMKIVL